MGRRSVEKVLVYVTRGGRELLAFEHRDFPEAGLQVPAGTVEAGEGPAAAASRELREEAGLDLPPGKLLGRFEWVRADRDELHLRNVFHFEAPPGLPDEWLHTVGGSGEDGGMVFRFFWLPTDVAKKKLAAEQGSYLP